MVSASFLECGVRLVGNEIPGSSFQMGSLEVLALRARERQGHSTSSCSSLVSVAANHEDGNNQASATPRRLRKSDRPGLEELGKQ